MIAGIGIDIVTLSRVAALHARWGRVLERRVLTSAEQAELPGQLGPRRRRLAMNLAAKEALVKALGTGMRWPASWRQIGVRRDALGAPRYAPQPELDSWLARQGLGRPQLSLSDERDTVVAVAVVEKG